jgi:lysyl-tRNA synthetase class 2
MNWWKPEIYAQKRDKLEMRMRLVRAVRACFDDMDFLEVETPALQISPGMEPHLHAFKTEIENPERDQARDLYLHTSPEFAMKKLLVAGLPKIYQICHVFRNAEGSSMHSAEFTMIEWYRANAGYKDIMADCEALLRQVAKACEVNEYRYQDKSADPFAAWEYLSVIEAYKKYADMDISPDATAQEWDELFYDVFLNKIEPQLGVGQPTILYDYPVSMAALSRPCSNDPRFAERFELYVCGVELANAFGELTDAKVQRTRFEADMALKEKLYGVQYPIDDDFIKALEHGMPESGGIALGIDRLAMLACGTDDIDDVLWCGKVQL